MCGNDAVSGQRPTAFGEIRATETAEIKKDSGNDSEDDDNDTNTVRKTNIITDY